MDQRDKTWELAFRDFRALSFIYIILLLIMLFLLSRGVGIIAVVFIGILSAVMIWLTILFKNQDKKAVTIGFPLTIVSLVLIILNFAVYGGGLQGILNIVVQGYLVYRVNTVRVMLASGVSQPSTGSVPPIKQ